MDSSSDDSDLEFLSQLSDWDCEETDEEEKARNSRRLIVNYSQSLNDSEFTFRFRLPKSAVDLLLTEIMPFVSITSSRNHALPPSHQLLLTLRFYALGEMLKTVAGFTGVSTFSASRIVRDMSTAISGLFDRYIGLHMDHVNKFQSIAGFPRVFGVIDCTHIPIQPSHLAGEEFRNSKGNLSINVQAVCDADLKFMNFEAYWPGSTDDATIFNKSILKAQCLAGDFGNNWLLGDGDYPNQAYLLTPVLNPVTEAEQKYNEAHTKTMKAIERTFEVWRRRFPVVSLSMRLSLVNASAVLTATAVLHNICLIKELEEIPPEIELPTEIEQDDCREEQSDQDFQQRNDLILSYFSSKVD